MKDVTVIIVTWNNEKIILDCLNSLYNICDNFKVIIVDNQSSDNTVSEIKSAKYEFCNVISSKENLGFAKANNLALELVDTPYVCFLNPDTILLEDVFNPSISILEHNEDIGLVGCKLLNSDKTLQKSCFNFDNHFQILLEMFHIGKFLPNFISEKVLPNESKCLNNKEVDWVIGAYMFLKTEDAQAVKGFSTEYYMYVEDMDLCKKLKLVLNKNVYYLADKNLIHLGGVSEAKNINYKKQEILLRNKVLFIQKFYSNKETKKYISSIKFGYRFRFFLIKLFYFGKNRNVFLDKFRNGYEIAKKMNIR